MDMIILGLGIIFVIGMLMLFKGIKTKKKWLILLSMIPLALVLVQVVIQIIMWFNFSLV